MPKTLTPAMRAHLDAGTTRLAAIWRITRKDGAQFFFTDHDRDIMFGGDTYRADAGFERTAIRSDAGFAVDNLDLVGVFAEGGIVEDDVRAGLFDGAEIAISFVNWQDPDGHGEIRLRRGTLGETRLTPQGYFTAELRGLAQPLALIVRMRAGGSRLETVTELEMLNGANQALVVDPDGAAEIIQFATVTANADGSHTLSTLLRGRRGTELFTGCHSLASVFVLIEDDTLSRLPVPLTALDAARSYRAVGRGDALRDAANTPITPVGRDLMPYAPVQLAASGSWGSDITLTWQRRTRIGGELKGGGGDVPLAEDSEAYELEILFGATVVRTVEDLTARSYVYSAANQASDFSGYIAQPLVNPGFETGDLTGWTIELNGTPTVDNAHESLLAAHGGTYFLRSTADSRIAQTVDVAFAAEQIDLVGATARARCWIAETASDTDTARVALQFLDAHDVELGVVEPSFTNPAGQTFVQIEAEGAIPVGTRQIKVRVAIDRVSGSTANVAVDDVTLEIDPGELRSLTVAAYQISGQVGCGFRGLRTVDVA